MSKGGKKSDELLAVSLDFGRVTLVQKMLFAKHLAVMLQAGIPIVEALKLLYSSSQGRLKHIIAEIYNAVKAGNSLAESLAGYPQVFSSFFHGAVLAGEASGNLEENLQNVAVQLKKDKELMDKVKAALFYPAIVLSAAAVIGLFVSLYILPKITPLLLSFRVALPWTTRLLIAVATLTQAWGAQILVVVAALVIFGLVLARQGFARGVSHRLLLRVPVLGSLLADVNLSRFTFNLGILLRSGLTITEALQLSTEALGNYAYREALMKVALAVNKGGRLSANLHNYPDYFPEIAVRMIKVGEESGHLEETLLYISEFYEAEIDNATKNLATAIEPIMLIIIGLVVGFLAIAIITPIYSITGSITR